MHALTRRGDRLTLLLSLHDVTPRHATNIERAEALFRQLGIDQATYLLVPRYHRSWPIENDEPFHAWCRAPRSFSVRWCLHGYHHLEWPRRRDWSPRDWLQRQWLTHGEGEFLTLRAAETRARLASGRRAFAACVGADPTGFVAPAWLFSRALLPALREQSFKWTEDHRRIYDLPHGTAIDAPVITWSTRTRVRRDVSVWLAARLLRRWREHPILRIAVHPLDFAHGEVVDSIARTIEQALQSRETADYERALRSARVRRR